MRKTILLLLFVFPFFLAAQIPQGYYDPAAGLSGSELKTALHNIIRGHTTYSYDDLKVLLKETDEDPNNSNNIILLYTGRSQDKATFGGDPNDWNREHVWAKSHGDFGESAPCGTDLHHMRPTDASVNSSRGNLDFDNGGTPHSEATECKIINGVSWEVRDAAKGDVARMMFYMAVRYEGTNGELNLELVDQLYTDGTPTFGKLSTLMEWNAQDPVDDFERNRHEVIYSYQHNRNPFVDHPEWVDAIWGQTSRGDKLEASSGKVSIFPNPAIDIAYIDVSDTESEYADIQIINAIGQPVKMFADQKTDKRISLDIADLDRGAYFIQVTSGNLSKVLRLIIED